MLIQFLQKSVPAIAAIFMLSFICSAQTTLTYTVNGDDIGDRFGESVAGAGDVNADGFDDFIVGSTRDDNNGSGSGMARVFSGADGSILYTFDGEAAGDAFGVAVAGAGDVNNDGFDDFIVGARANDNAGADAGNARVFSGMNGTILYTIHGAAAGDNFGASVAGLGDTNLDGFDDFAIGAVGTDLNGSNSGSVWVYSGFDGSNLISLFGNAAGDSFGFSVASAGDVNGDGSPDIAVGAPGSDINGSVSGSMTIFSGSNGNMIHTFHGDSGGDGMGESVSGLGDINGDGHSDVLVGVPFDDDGGSNAGSARVYSGLGGAILFHFDGDNADDRFGGAVSVAGDINGDGRNDILVGARQDDNSASNSGSVRVISGRDGSTVTTLNGTGASDFFGQSVASAGDINGDGFADIIVGAWLNDNNGNNAGSAQVFTSDTLPVLHVATQSGLPHFMDLEWLPVGGNPNSLTGSLLCSSATPGGLGIIGASSVSVDTVLFGFLPLLLDVNPPNLILTETFGFTLLGELLVTGVTRQNPPLAGTFVYVQCFQSSPLVFSSNALRILAAP